MSAVSLTDRRILALVCDGCRRGLAGLTAHTSAWNSLWSVADCLGWTGEGHRRGPHRCPRCADPGTDSGSEKARAGERLQVDLSGMGRVLVVRLGGDLDVAVGAYLRTVLNRARLGYRHVVLDLRAVRRAELGTLVDLALIRQDVLRAGGLLCYVAGGPAVTALMATMRAGRPIPCFDTLEAARAWLATAPPAGTGLIEGPAARD